MPRTTRTGVYTLAAIPRATAREPAPQEHRDIRWHICHTRHPSLLSRSHFTYAGRVQVSLVAKSFDRIHFVMIALFPKNLIGCCEQSNVHHISWCCYCQRKIYSAVVLHEPEHSSRQSRKRRRRPRRSLPRCLRCLPAPLARTPGRAVSTARRGQST